MNRSEILESARKDAYAAIGRKIMEMRKITLKPLPPCGKYTLSVNAFRQTRMYVCCRRTLPLDALLKIARIAGWGTLKPIHTVDACGYLSIVWGELDGERTKYRGCMTGSKMCECYVLRRGKTRYPVAKCTYANMGCVC
jgi:hypothetical protein